MSTKAEPSGWDKTVMRAWLMRLDGERRNPVRAAMICRRYLENIERVQAWHSATREPRKWGGVR
jgi:hypothetical protein